MNWSEEQRKAVEDEYRRIGYVRGDLWPAPPPECTPVDLMALLRRVPDGTGREGWTRILGELRRG
ncbi:MAG: hypothetical protein ACYC0B_08765 [Gemmatimonadaceae bacterium]